MDIPVVNIPDGFNIKEFTESKFDGTGVLDVMLKTVELHLKREFDEDRIRGTDYANAYVNLLNSFAGIASQYGLAKVKQPLELQLLEAEIYKTGADTVLATKQGGLVDAQITTETAKAEMLHLEMQYKFPKELEMIDAQIAHMKAEIALKQKELEIKEKELILKDKQIEISLKEIALKEKQLQIAQFELDRKLPAEVRLIEKQADLYGQKVITETAQTDPSVIKPDSVIDRNNEVLKQQAIAYVTDGRIKGASILVDTWKIRRNDDPDEAPVNGTNMLADPNIGTAVGKILAL